MINDFSIRVREMREDLGLSQEELAYRAHTSRRGIQRIENGEVPSLSVADSVMTALGARYTIGRKDDRNGRKK